MLALGVAGGLEPLLDDLVFPAIGTIGAIADEFLGRGQLDVGDLALSLTKLVGDGLGEDRRQEAFESDALL